MSVQVTAVVPSDAEHTVGLRPEIRWNNTPRIRSRN
jgi:hypothetical protein